MEELLPNLGRQCTKLYGGNVPTSTAAIGVGGVVEPLQNTLDEVESANLSIRIGILLPSV